MAIKLTQNAGSRLRRYVSLSRRRDALLPHRSWYLKMCSVHGLTYMPPTILTFCRGRVTPHQAARRRVCPFGRAHEGLRARAFSEDLCRVYTGDETVTRASWDLEKLKNLLTVGRGCARVKFSCSPTLRLLIILIKIYVHSKFQLKRESISVFAMWK